MRYLSLLHFTERHSRTAITSMLKVSRASVNKWVTTYLSQGLYRLDDKPNPGRPPQLSLELQASLKAFVQQRSLSEQRGRLMPRELNHFI